MKEDASVHIKVFDLAGDLVAELSSQGIGGLDNEIAWNVSDVESGIYFASGGGWYIRIRNCDHQSGGGKIGGRLPSSLD